MNRSRLVLPLLAALLFQGCFSSIVRATGPNGSKHSEAGASLFWGIGTPTHGATQCEYGLKEVEMYRPWYSHFIGVLTLGIVTPITATWECMGPPQGTHHAAPVVTQ